MRCRLRLGSGFGRKLCGLNGTWKFLYSDSHRRLPADVTSATADLAGWCDIQVPGNWEVQGHGVAIYTNQWFEFKASDPQPPLLPDDIPVGVYRREIDIPAEWLQTRDVYLHLAGAKSGVYVYINGQEVGYNEAISTGRKWDITKIPRIRPNS